MSIRLDPRRLGTLKHLAGEAGVRPGDLVRQWVEERIDAQRTGPGGQTLEARVAALEERIAALTGEDAAPPQKPAEPAAAAGAAAAEQPDQPGATSASSATPDEAPEQPSSSTTQSRRVSAKPARVGLHDEMIAVLADRGPMAAAELAAAISERGRYTPPRSGRQLDAAMISQRASNPTYRARFQRREGRIGLAEEAP